MKDRKFINFGLFLLILLLAFVLRFYKLGEIPTGLYRDETAIGYNAYSILTTGKDEYGRKLPLYFQSFGDYKLPVYIYSTVVSVKLFGLNAFAVRFPSALFGFLTVIVFYFLVKELTKDENFSLLSTFIFSITPWTIHYNRATYEVSMSLFLYLLGTLFLIWAFRKKLPAAFFIGTLCFIVTLYSYNLTRLLSPVLYFGTLLLFRKEFKNINKLELMPTLITSFVLLIPFALTFGQNGGVSSASGTLLSSSAVVKAPLVEFRSYMITLPQSFITIFFNSNFQLLWQYLQNIATYLSVTFFFISGATQGNQGIGNVGQFYLFELPLFILGISMLFKENKFIKSLMFFWVGATILIASFTRDVPHGTRSFFLIFPMVFIICLGLKRVISWISKINTSYIKISAYAILLIIFTYNIVYYLSSYFVRFPVAYARQWNEEDKNLSLYISQNENKYNKIVFDNSSKFPYTSYLFYNMYNPDKFQKEQQRYPADSEGFTLIRVFDKFEFRDIDWKLDLKAPKTLFITTLEDIPQGYPILKTFYFPKRPVVLALGQNIFQYPTQDTAYVLIETK